MAGVIGGHKPQFSLIGDTVNMAARVCSTGETNSVTLSDQAKFIAEREVLTHSLTPPSLFLILPLKIKKLNYGHNGSVMTDFLIILTERSVVAKGKGTILTH